MKKDKTKATASEASMDGVQLVASLLMCFPEMGKVTLDAKEEGIWLDFTLKESPSEELMTQADKLLTDSIRLYHELEGITGARVAFFYEDGAIHVFRDIGSLTRQEISMIVSLVLDSFNDLLLTDPVRSVDEDMLYNQSEMIDHRIFFLRQYHIPENMVGIREDGRVMVY